jgi:hypothetical protein
VVAWGECTLELLSSSSEEEVEANDDSDEEHEAMREP